jgi:hypothetical protein
MQALTKLTALLGLFTVASNATFVLVNPPPVVGLSQITPPCAGGTVTPSSDFTEWPTAGLDIMAMNVTELFGPTFTIKVALLEDGASFIPWYQSQSGRDGRMCIARLQPWRIEGWNETEWLGKNAVLQISEYVGNGVRNYAVKLALFLLLTCRSLHPWCLTLAYRFLSRTYIHIYR